ncbi:MAG: peptide-methionine (R)-S-oxide reductase MsrB [Pseudomonadota bacterium]
MSDKIVKSDAQWRRELTPEQYRIAREKGTERPFSHAGFPKKPGVFHCVACGQALFESDAKFESYCGWPSFTEPQEGGALEEHRDVSHGMVRTEVTCSRCDAHLGHVFPDGPTDRGGLRYCINGAVLQFVPKEDAVEREE